MPEYRAFQVFIMRMDIRLRGRTGSGRACLMDLTVYADRQDQFMSEVHTRATEGPWYYEPGAEPVPETETVTVEQVEQLGSKKRQVP